MDGLGSNEKREKRTSKSGCQLPAPRFEPKAYPYIGRHLESRAANSQMGFTCVARETLHAEAIALLHS